MEEIKMPDQQIDKGNPNVFTTYRGRYEFTMAEGATCNSPYAMLTSMNTVQFKIYKDNPDNLTTYRKVIP